MTGNQRQKLQAVFGALLLLTIGPVSGLGAGAGPLLGQAGNAGNTGAGNQPTGGSAGNQPTGDIGQLSGWNESTTPNASQIATLGPRANASEPFAVVAAQPTDPNNDGFYEDVNGDGVINVVDSDALRRHLNTTAVGANWSAYDYTDDNRTDVGDVRWLFARTTGVPINDRDADGLPNTYELNVTNTNPDVADTDGDGVIDGEEDWDNDTLSAYREYQLGTDPYAVDSDGDGLSDTMESYRAPLDPANNDSDNDGTPDGQEDLDGDGLAVSILMYPCHRRKTIILHRFNPMAGQSRLIQTVMTTVTGTAGLASTGQITQMT
jgi:hypothetical protein